MDQPTSIHGWKKQIIFVKNDDFSKEKLNQPWNTRNKLNNFFKQYEGSATCMKAIPALNVMGFRLSVQMDWLIGLLEAGGLAGSRITNLKLLSKLYQFKA